MSQVVGHSPTLDPVREEPPFASHHSAYTPHLLIATTFSWSRYSGERFAIRTGFEPATSSVTGKRSNQIELRPHMLYDKGILAEIRLE